MSAHMQHATKSYPDVRVENNVDAVTVAATIRRMTALWRSLHRLSEDYVLTSGHQVLLAAGAKRTHHGRKILLRKTEVLQTPTASQVSVSGE